MAPTNDIFEYAAEVSGFLKALANDNRLVILCALTDGEKSVGELEASLGIRQPTLSQQLARLRADDLVATRRDARQIYYSLNSNEARQVVGLLCEIYLTRSEAENACGGRPRGLVEAA